MWNKGDQRIWSENHKMSDTETNLFLFDFRCRQLHLHFFSLNSLQRTPMQQSREHFFFITKMERNFLPRYFGERTDSPTHKSKIPMKIQRKISFIFTFSFRLLASAEKLNSILFIIFCSVGNTRIAVSTEYDFDWLFCCCFRFSILLFLRIFVFFFFIFSVASILILFLVLCCRHACQLTYSAITTQTQQNILECQPNDSRSVFPPVLQLGAHSIQLSLSLSNSPHARSLSLSLIIFPFARLRVCGLCVGLFLRMCVCVCVCKSFVIGTDKHAVAASTSRIFTHKHSGISMTSIDVCVCVFCFFFVLVAGDCVNRSNTMWTLRIRSHVMRCRCMRHV